MIRLLASTLFILFVSICLAGEEMQINTYTDSTQRDPQIARDKNGNYAVVWNSEEQEGFNSKGDIYLQLFDEANLEVGEEHRVNVITQGDQERPAIGMHDDGNFVIVWSSLTDLDSAYDIKARVYKNNNPFTSEFIVNTATAHSQTNPEVAMDSQGGFIVVWDSWFQDGSDRGVFAQRYDKDGLKTGSEIQVNTTTTYSQARPDVKFLPDDRFLVTWESWNQDDDNPSGYGIYGQLFNTHGEKINDEFQVNSSVENYQWFSSIESFSDSTFIVVWCSWEQDGDDGGIFLQRFDKDAKKVGEELKVNHQTIYYQWLPRIVNLDGKNFAVIWSSWKQDGSREGIVARFFNEEDGTASLEVNVNDYVAGYQWEPDVIKTADNELLVVWSSWGELGKDYEIKAKNISAHYTQGVLNPFSYEHEGGNSTASFIVHVLDSTALTGDEYSLHFEILASDTALVNIKNRQTDIWVVKDYRIYKGSGYSFITPVFEGVRVEIIPEFEFRLDEDRSTFINNSGSTLQFSLSESSVGTKNLAPIDVALVWGDLAKGEDGRYLNPIDTAMGIDGLVDNEVPFIAVNLSDNSRLDLLIVDEDEITNNQWDPKERIILFTPSPYSNSATDTHLQVGTNYSPDTLILPAESDTNLIYTIRPLSNTDVFTFRTIASDILNVEEKVGMSPGMFEIYQNYPNPFNPSTKVGFYIPKSGKVNVSVYNVLGQKIDTLIDERQKQGYHSVNFNGSGLASGMYFYVIRFNGQFQSKRMLLIK